MTDNVSQRIHFLLEVKRVTASSSTTEHIAIDSPSVALFVRRRGVRVDYLFVDCAASPVGSATDTCIGRLETGDQDEVRWTSAEGDVHLLSPGQSVPGFPDVTVGPPPPRYKTSTTARVALEASTPRREGPHHRVEIEAMPVERGLYHRFAVETFRDVAIRDQEWAAAVSAEGAAAFARSRGARLPTHHELTALYETHPATRLTTRYPWEWVDDPEHRCVRAVGNGGALHPRSHQRSINDPGRAHFRLAYDAPLVSTTVAAPQARALVALSPQALAGRRPLACFRDVGRSGTWILFDDDGGTEIAFVDRHEMRTVGLVPKGVCGGAVLDDGSVVLFYPHSILYLSTGERLPLTAVCAVWGPNLDRFVAKTADALLQYDGGGLQRLVDLRQGMDGLGHPDSGWVVWKWDGSFRYECTFGDAAGVTNVGTRRTPCFYVSAGALRAFPQGSTLDGFIAPDGSLSSIDIGQRFLHIRHAGTHSQIDMQHTAVARLNELFRMNPSIDTILEFVPFQLGGDGRVWHVDDGTLYTDVESEVS